MSKEKTSAINTENLGPNEVEINLNLIEDQNVKAFVVDFIQKLEQVQKVIKTENGTYIFNKETLLKQADYHGRKDVIDFFGTPEEKERVFSHHIEIKMDLSKIDDLNVRNFVEDRSDLAKSRNEQIYIFGLGFYENAAFHKRIDVLEHIMKSPLSEKEKEFLLHGEGEQEEYTILPIMKMQGESIPGKFSYLEFLFKHTTDPEKRKNMLNKAWNKVCDYSLKYDQPDLISFMLNQIDDPSFQTTLINRVFEHNNRLLGYNIGTGKTDKLATFLTSHPQTEIESVTSFINLVVHNHKFKEKGTMMRFEPDGPISGRGENKPLVISDELLNAAMLKKYGTSLFAQLDKTEELVALKAAQDEIERLESLLKAAKARIKKLESSITSESVGSSDPASLAEMQAIEALKKLTESFSIVEADDVNPDNNKQEESPKSHGSQSSSSKVQEIIKAGPSVRGPNWATTSSRIEPVRSSSQER